MAALTDEARVYFERLAEEHHAACVKDGCQAQHERDLWRVIHGSAPAVKRGA